MNEMMVGPAGGGGDAGTTGADNGSLCVAMGIKKTLLEFVI